MSLTNNQGASAFIGVNVHEKIEEKIEQDYWTDREATNQAKQPTYVKKK